MGTAYNMLGGGGAGGIKLESIAITAPPLKTAYRAGESFDPAGMVVTATYSNGATLVATGCAAEPSGPLADGTTEVTVRYTEGGRSATASVAITVSPRLAALRIASPPAKTAYRWGESFDPAGMAVEAVYTDGSAKPVSGFTTAPGQFAALGAQEVTVSYAEDGDMATAAVSVTVGRTVIAAVPSQSGTPVYTGGVLSPEWSGFDPDKLTLGGTASAIDVGTYEAAFTPTQFYEWGDGSTAAKLVPWAIGKAAGSLSLDKQAVTLNAAAPMAVLQVNRAGDGAVSAVSSDTGVATVSVSGTQITVSSVGKTSGSAVITVTVGEGRNHTAPASVTCQVTASFAIIYGAEWDGTSTTKLSRTDMAAGFVDPTPAVNNGTGSSPFDSIMPWSGMKRVTDAQAGELVEIPKFWYKLTKNGDALKIQISAEAVDGFSVSPAHMDRGDGKGERNVVYVGRYHCASTYKSTTKVRPVANITRATARTNIHKLGTAIWQWDFAMIFTIWLLYLVEFADWDSQKCIGNGCGKGSGSALQNMGNTDSMQYHTGTSLTKRDDFGQSMQYRWIEELWDNAYDWLDGGYNDKDGMNIILNPNNFNDNSGGITVGMPGNGYPSALGISHSAGFPIFYPSSSAPYSGQSCTADMWGFSSGMPCLYHGAEQVSSTWAGLFYIHYNGAITANSVISCRLMKLP